MKWKRLLAGMLSAVMLMAGFTACSGEETGKTEKTTESGETAAEGEAVEKIQLLTHVFRGDELVLPEGLTRNNCIAAVWENGRLKICCESADDRNYICEMNPDGSEPVLTEIILDVESPNITYGSFTDDGMVFLAMLYDAETREYQYNLYIYHPSDGSYTKTENIDSFLPSQDYIVLSGAAEDGDGNIYVVSDSSFFVLDSEGVKLFDMFVSNILGLCQDESGNVYLKYWDFGSGYVIERINPETKQLEKAFDFPELVEAENYCFGPGYEIYYSNPTGLYGWNTGMENGEMVLNWANSNLNTDGGVCYIEVLSPGTVLFSKADTGSLFLELSDDVDLTQIVTVEVACVEEARELPEAVIRFNRNNENIRVVVRDYSQYNTKENGYTGGMTRLVNDMMGGLYKPDIVCGDSELISVMVENNLYTDLYSFMDGDSAVRKDDIFGCIKNYYEVDGKLSALCYNFTISTLLARTEDVGGKTSWSLSEMLDYAESMEDGKRLIIWLHQENAAERMLGQNSWAEFVDMENHTCDFESELFIRYLHYLSTLPKDRESASLLSGQSMSELYHTGQAMVFPQTYYKIDDIQRDIVSFNTPDVVRIGYPTVDPEKSGVVLEPQSTYMVTSLSEYPEEAWAFLSDLLSYTEPSRGVSWVFFRILKSAFYQYAEIDLVKEMNTFYSFSGGSNGWTGESDAYDPEKSTYQGEPGVLVKFSMDAMEEFMVWLDSVGVPLTDTMPEEITAMVNEEITAFTSGARTAEDTAKIIQSRVSIWLAEHE